jgi:tetratricopeptide (TPR) repeat protein
MSMGDWDLDKQTQYWRKRKDLQTKIKQLDTQLAEARAALLDGRIPAAKRLFLESREVELEAQGLAGELNVPAPSGRTATAFSQVIREKLDATVQGDLIDAAQIRMQFQGIIEIEQALTGGESRESAALLPRALFEKGEQALRLENFDRAEEYLKQIIDLGGANTEAEIRLADVLLRRARHARASDHAAAQLFINQARSVYDRVKAAPEFAARRSGFENQLAEEQAATYFAVGEQAQQKFNWPNARKNFRLVPEASSYGPQARERVTALTVRIRRLAIAGVAFATLLLLFLVWLYATTPPAVATCGADGTGCTATPPRTSASSSTPLTSSPTPALAATSALATAPSTTPDSASPMTAVTPVPTAATVATTSLPTAEPPSPSAAPPTPTVVVLVVKIAKEGVAVYEKSDRAKSGPFLLYVPKDRTYYMCDRDDNEGSYLISLTACDTSSAPLGWVNRDYVTLLIATPTP